MRVLERYTARFVVWSRHTPGRKLVALVQDVRDRAGNLVRNHAWLQLGFESPHCQPILQSGEMVEFYAWRDRYRRLKPPPPGVELEPCISFRVAGCLYPVDFDQEGDTCESTSVVAQTLAPAACAVAEGAGVDPR
ncbi:hypothetical protein Aaci_1093 [Alicyclobacillus acidocaldarius subsp. acidocaldarius DSM 446]|uniref:Uncharacterized protein n=1 Tax=Alicyclobacillus acidocaldarius subsp. acidocaldarius (strain ATCC 27009 / DSM 446 / BCRC 14685 / JCM 5260 / KCTC 1825 / NBRC 15652 / NCIMB 11725 / NRRL B-14509 / 104-IA) TaxID=521098 RepID=C8WVK7_ALIAD|nr:hypothetical protein Aaci_1093 [Alicyclobacillus acidocaldarius subsp. acidocaldarius DSM 446]